MNREDSLARKSHSARTEDWTKYPAQSRHYPVLRKWYVYHDHLIRARRISFTSLAVRRGPIEVAAICMRNTRIDSCICSNARVARDRYTYQGLTLEHT
jgi:hypothetical protein